MKKRIALLLSLLMLASSIISCSDEGQEDISNDTESADALQSESDISVESETVNERLLIDDELPDETFGGQDFIIATQGDILIDAEEVIGESVNDASYNRNITVEDRFKVNIEFFTSSADTVLADIKKAVQSGTTDFHTAVNSGIFMGQAVGGNIFLNMHDLEYVDFEKPWWSPSNEEDLTVNGILFFGIGDFALSTIGHTYCVLYDKLEAGNYHIDDLYTTVKEGKWTIDYLLGISEGISKDLDGNGVMDKADFYGFSSDTMSNLNTYVWAFGNKIYNKNSAGELEYVFYNERTIESYEKLLSIISAPGVYAPANFEHGTGYTLFCNYQTIFANTTIDMTRNLGDYENEYGVLPYPKLNEEQDDYYTMVDGAHNVIAVPNVPIDTEYVGIIIEALCAETYKQVVPEYLDVCLKKRYSSSPEDAEMIDKCVENRIFDFGYIYDGYGSAFGLLPQKMANGGRSDFVSYYKKYEKIAMKTYNTYLDAFYDYEG